MSDDASDSVLSNRLMAIENILASAAALNGGFDKLMVAIASIKDSQDELKESMKKISVTIYDPAQGILTKVRDAEGKLTEHEKFEDQLDPIIDRHKEMSLWIGTREKDLERWEDRKTSFMIEMDRLTQWKNNVTRLLWLIGGSTAGLVAKTFFSMLAV